MTVAPAIPASPARSGDLRGTLLICTGTQVSSPLRAELEGRRSDSMFTLWSTFDGAPHRHSRMLRPHQHAIEPAQTGTQPTTIKAMRHPAIVHALSQTGPDAGPAL